MGIAQSALSAGHPDHFLAIFQDLHFLLTGLFVPGNSAQGYFNNNIFSIAAMTVIGPATFTILGQYVFVIA